MKKGLIVLLIFILVVGAFFAGTNINFKKENDLTTTKVSTTEEETYIEYEPEGFAKIGRDFDTLLKIVDWHIGVPGESVSHVLINIADKQGYYLESPYAAPIYIWHNWEMYDKYWNYDKEVFSISTYSDDYETFNFYDDNTLVIGEGDDEDRIIIEEIITIKDNGSIIKTRIDRFGFDDDETDVYFFVTNFEKLITLPNDEVGEEVYTYGGDFAGYSERMIYFDR